MGKQVGKTWLTWLGFLPLVLVGCQPAGRQSTDAAPTDASASPAAKVSLTDEIITQHNRAVALMGQFNYEAAYDVLQELAEAHPAWLDVHVDWAIATLNRRRTGDSEQALKLLGDVVQRDADHARAKYCLGILQLDGGDPEGALASFRAVADADPADAYAQYYTGQCLSQLGQMEEALARFERALAKDPYLRSCYYGAFQACLRLGKTDEADRYRQAFERLEGNPQSRLAEIKYTRMGPKATLSILAANEVPRPRRPDGELFQPSVPLNDVGGREIPWRKNASDIQITLAEIRSGGPLVLCMTQASTDATHPNVVLRAVAAGWEWWPEHPLSTVADVHAVAWGDYDNDGLTDFYCAAGTANQLWRQTAPDTWIDVTESTGTAAAGHVTRDVQMCDADHDGDLDLLLSRETSNELLNNNLDGTFRPLAQEQALGGRGGVTTTHVVADLDGDRDLDLVAWHEQAPHEAYWNDRLWAYRPAEGLGALLGIDAEAVLPVDSDVDGRTDLWTLAQGQVTRWTRGSQETWQGQPWNPAGLRNLGVRAPLAWADLDGNGQGDLVASCSDGWCVIDGASGDRLFQTTEPASTWRLVHRSVQQGPEVVSWTDQGPRWYAAGEGRFAFAQLRFTGKQEQADQMRSNRSGVGIQAAARVGAQWISLRTLRTDTQIGQSLQPISVGLAGRSQLDFVSLTWSDGIFQTEYDLLAGKVHEIAETQRQVASCPVVFAWNGQEFAFVTDVLGGGGLGFNLGKGEYAEPRPVENLKLPSGALQARDGRYSIRIAEPMEEVCYLDALRLVRYQVPPGYELALDERFAVAGPPATGEPVVYRVVHAPIGAQNDRGDSVLDAIRSVDGRAAEPGELDRRFVGRTAPHEIEMEFAEPLVGGALYLQMFGWIEYPYSQTMFAAWQAGATFEAPTLEAQRADGTWQVVWHQFGYPAGMPREALLPLPADRLPAGTRRLRLRTNQEIYWDQLAVIQREAIGDLGRTEYPLVAAEVTEVGFAQRTLHAQRRPTYDYANSHPVWDTRHLRGMYSEFGDVQHLVRGVDDAVAVIGPGEQVACEFAAPTSVESDGTRRNADSREAVWVLEFHGWCKDMDLYTRDGETVEPLPRGVGRVDAGAEKQRRDWHDANHRRYRAGY